MCELTRLIRDGDSSTDDPSADNDGSLLEGEISLTLSVQSLLLENSWLSSVGDMHEVIPRERIAASTSTMGI